MPKRSIQQHFVSTQEIKDGLNVLVTKEHFLSVSSAVRAAVVLLLNDYGIVVHDPLKGKKYARP